MLTIIGTSHISPESVKKVTKIIEEKKPDIVALELDRKRLEALIQGHKGGIELSHIFKIGIKGWLFGNIGALVERKLGEKTGIAPGTEMIEAYKTARKNNAKIELIDQDIDITLKKGSSITWKEKWNLIKDIIAGVFGKAKKIDLAKVPEKRLIQTLIKEMKQKYPTLYRVLVQERNQYMAKKLAIIMKKNPNKHVLAVIGAGHEEDVSTQAKEYLNKIDIAQ
ncbi:TraB/GumN family protein [Candidatus Woesearchaeota archaeon]|nr:TraB/GumN family protein [Candidatus Woesearchaeota archaeon]